MTTVITIVKLNFMNSIDSISTRTQSIAVGVGIAVLFCNALAPETSADRSTHSTYGPHKQIVGAISAADTLARGEQGTAYFSEELITELGYEPGMQNGIATNPTGDCSSPVPVPESFEPACQTHDLGYDLLRVADRTGEPIPGNTRADLDRQLKNQMWDSCDSFGCRATATAAHIVVGANTVRQGNGAPIYEAWARWLPWS